MEHTPFAYDFGILPSPDVLQRPLTNVTELIWQEDLLRVLRLCGVAEREIGKDASDFEKWSALCRSLPLLRGHWLPEYLAFVLRSCFSIDVPVSPETTALLWHEVADALRREPMTLLQALQKQNGGEELPILTATPFLEAPPTGATPVWDLNALLQTSAASWEHWRAEIAAGCRAFAKRGGRLLSLRLPAVDTFVAPNPYAVTTILKKKARTASDNFLLLSQILRELSLCPEAGEWRLVLSVEGQVAPLLALLSYVASCGVLPSLAVCTTPSADLRPLLSFASEVDAPPIRFGFSVADHPTPRALEQAMSDLARQYPLGRLALCTHTHLLCLPYARVGLMRSSNALH